MENRVVEIKIPNLGVNDTTAQILSFEVENGDLVELGQIIAQCETTKMSVDIESPEKGYIYFLDLNFENKLTVGTVFGFISTEQMNENESKIVKEKYQLSELKSYSKQYKATKKAEKKAEELGVNISLIKKDGLIKEKDVLEYSGITNNYKKDNSMINGLLPVFIYGAGKGGMNILETIMQNFMFLPFGYIDDDDNLKNTYINSMKIFTFNELIEKMGWNNLNVVIGFENREQRYKVYETITNNKGNVVTITHPKSIIESSVKIGQGTFIKSGAIIDTNTSIGKVCIIDNGVVIPHDNNIGNSVHIAPGVTLGSSIFVDDFSLIGIGANISTGVKIGKSVIVLPGASVQSDVEDNAVVGGVPAKMVVRR